jgi:T5SS/PEP-CTERM-associated repeat protein
MARFVWTGGAGDDKFSNPLNWEDLSSRKHHGFPGAGDNADLTGASDVIVDGNTVANLIARGCEIAGSLTVTGKLEGGYLTGGNVTVGTLDDASFAGITLAATVIEGGSSLDAGTASTTLLASSFLEGAAISTDAIGRGKSHGPCQILETAGSLTDAGTMKLVYSTQRGADYLTVGGTATIAGAATVNGSEVYIQVGDEGQPGSLDLKSSLSLSNGGALDVYSGEAEAAQATAGARGTGTIDLANGGTACRLTVARNVVLGNGTGDGVLDIGSGAELIVRGSLEAAVAGPSTSITEIGGGGRGLTVHGEWRLGVGGSATAAINGGPTSASATAAGGLVLGSAAGGSGSMSVSGASTELMIGRFLTIGGAGSGQLTIEDGGLVTLIAGGKGTIDIAGEKGSSGEVSLAGAGSTLRGGALAAGGTLGRQGGAGSLSLADGSVASFSTATVWTNGAVTDAGNLTIAAAVTGNGALEIETGGLLDLGGSDKTVSVAFDGGTLELDSVRRFSAEIAGFGAGDAIDLAGVKVSGKSFADGALSLSDGAALRFSGKYSLGNFNIVAGAQGTEITYQTVPLGGEPVFGSTAHHAILGVS